MIRLQPEGATVAVCDDARFRVTAEGDAPLTYQWKRNGVPIDAGTTGTFVVQGVVPADDGQVFTVTVTNRFGSLTSQGAVLHVDTRTPSPLASQVLSSRQGWLIAVSSSMVGWTDGTGVYVAPALCGRPSRVVYLKSLPLEATSGIALDADRVVWTDNGRGRVLSAPVGGGAATVLANLGGMGPDEIVISGSDVYWPQPLIGIRKMAVAGGPVTTVDIPGSWSDGITVDDQYVYWNDMAAHTVNRMPLTGGEPGVLASGQGYLGGIATDGTFVYWASTDESTSPPTGHILRIPRGGGTPTSLTSQPVYTLNLAVDAGYVYWTAANIRSSFAGSGSVSKVPVDGSAPATNLASGISPFGIAVDARFVYWTEIDAVGGNAGRVVRVPKS